MRVQRMNVQNVDVYARSRGNENSVAQRVPSKRSFKADQTGGIQTANSLR